jgi:hypothetical protein
MLIAPRGRRRDPKGGSTFEAIDPPDHSEPGFLHDLLRDRPVTNVDESDPEKRGAVPVDQRGEAALVAGLEPAQEALLFERQGHSRHGRVTTSTAMSSRPKSRTRSRRPYR